MMWYGLLGTLLGTLLLLCGGVSSCTLQLHEGSKAGMVRAFERSVRRGAMVVRFHLFLHDDASGGSVRYVNGDIVSGDVTPFSASNNDTFAPNLWFWAQKNGKYILRVPMDYHVLSFGIMSLYIDDMDVLLVADAPNCTDEVPYSEAQSLVTSALYDGIIAAKELAITADVLCRSAFTYSYFLGRIIGVKGCERNVISGNFTCDSFTYMKGWEMTWFGPLAVIVLFYIYILLTLYKEYISYKELKGEGRDIQKKMNLIEQKILYDVKRIRRQLYGSSIEDNFIEFLQEPTFLDILGVSKCVQSKVLFVFQVVVTLLLFGAYYSVFGYSIYYHGLPQQRRLIELIDNSQEMYANVFSHMAWLYANDTLDLKTYALAEAIITGLVPLVMFFLYIMFTESLRKEKIVLQAQKVREKHKDGGAAGFKFLVREHYDVQVRAASCCQAFATSVVGIAVSVILGFVVVLFWLCIGGVYMIYSLYMIGVGSFLTLNLFAGWLLPAALCVYYSYAVFNPLFELYTVVKQKTFSEIHKRGYLVKTDDYMLAPTSVIEKFYYGVSRGKVFEGFQRVFVSLAMLLMLFLIFIASQYPDFDITSKNSNLVMGVNIAIILPFLASIMMARQALSDLEKEMLAQDISKHVDEWETENQAMVEALKIRVEKIRLGNMRQGKKDSQPAPDAVPPLMALAAPAAGPNDSAIFNDSVDVTEFPKADPDDVGMNDFSAENREPENDVKKSKTSKV